MKRAPVKMQIEKTWGIRRKEIPMTKNKGEGIKRLKVRYKSTKEKMLVRPEQWNRALKNFPKFDFIIHQHLPIGKEPTGRMIVAVGDIRAFSEFLSVKKAKTGVTAIFDRKGVIGYIFYKLNKPLTIEIGDTIRKKIKDSGVHPADALNYNATITEYLKPYGVEIKRRFVPMQGYRYDKTLGAFVKVEK